MDKQLFYNKHLNQEDKVRNDILSYIKNDGINDVTKEDIYIKYGTTNYGFKD
jgi:hypothetical protein